MTDRRMAAPSREQSLIMFRLRVCSRTCQRTFVCRTETLVSRLGPWKEPYSIG